MIKIREKYLTTIEQKDDTCYNNINICEERRSLYRDDLM